MPHRALLMIFAFFPAMVTAAPVDAASFKVVYGASVLGLPVGTLEISTIISDRSYDMQAHGKVSGVAGMVSDGKGGAKASGALKGGSILKSQFEAVVRLGASQKAVRIETASGVITALSMEPPMDDKPGRVPVGPEHKRGVVDPLSAVLMPRRAATLSPEDCNRTIAVFDGGARTNLEMHYSETRQADIGGYKGPVVVCKVRYAPLAGHRPDRRIIKYMVANKDISAWLAPVAGTAFVAPLRVTVKTVVGPAALEAERWSSEAP